MINKEITTKIVNFMNQRAGDLVLGHGHMRHIVKNALFL